MRHSISLEDFYDKRLVSIYVNMMVQCIGKYSAFRSEVIRQFAKFNLRFYLR